MNDHFIHASEADEPPRVSYERKGLAVDEVNIMNSRC